MSGVAVTALSDRGRTDFHTHILPEMDDGSRSAAESVQMVRTCVSAGIDSIVLTPHFYAEADSPEAFIARRQRSFRLLTEAVAEAPDLLAPTFTVGAEIEYFEGIACVRDYPEMRIGGTNCFLIEMPPDKWTYRMVDDLLELCADYRSRVILAHVERYLFDQPRSTVRVLLENGVLMQSNASFFLEKKTAGKAIRLLRRGMIHLLGSDCHDTVRRVPNLGDACDVIEARAGKEYTDRIMQGARVLLRLDKQAVPQSV